MRKVKLDSIFVLGRTSYKRFYRAPGLKEKLLSVLHFVAIRFLFKFKYSPMQIAASRPVAPCVQGT